MFDPHQNDDAEPTTIEERQPLHAVDATATAIDAIAICEFPTVDDAVTVQAPMPSGFDCDDDVDPTVVELRVPRWSW